MSINILMIGIVENMLNALSDRPDVNFYAIEEEELYKNNHCESISAQNLKQIFIGEYMHSTGCIAIAKQLNSKVKIDGVIPGRDYAVRAASLIAKELGLCGLGIKASEILTNKIKLRELCKEYNIPHPRYQKINSLQDLQEFFIDKPIIFKPANRQASLGISLINKTDEILQAYNYTTMAEEDGRRIVPRSFTKEFIAEDYIPGFEVSIESLVKNGMAVFHNITAKTTFENNFVELQHVVPAKLESDVAKKLIDNINKFINSLGVQDGILHSEWKIHEGNPYLIECAGRIPGDFICRLIGNAYKINFYECVCKIACGHPLNIDNKAKLVSTIRYFYSKPGRLKEIKGIDILEKENIKDFHISVKAGDVIKSVTSSWDRIGYFIFTADSYDKVNSVTQDVVSGVKFIVE